MDLSIDTGIAYPPNWKISEETLDDNKDEPIIVIKNLPKEISSSELKEEIIKKYKELKNKYNLKESEELDNTNTHKTSNTTNSPVINPSHYNKGNIECIDAIKESMSEEAYKGFLKGNVIKYLWRYEDKNKKEDLDKASVYLEWLKSSM